MSTDQRDEGLFKMTPVELPVVERGPVDKTFRPFQPDQILLVPPSLECASVASVLRPCPVE